MKRKGSVLKKVPARIYEENGAVNKKKIYNKKCYTNATIKYPCNCPNGRSKCKMCSLRPITRNNKKYRSDMRKATLVY